MAFISEMTFLHANLVVIGATICFFLNGLAIILGRTRQKASEYSLCLRSTRIHLQRLSSYLFQVRHSSGLTFSPSLHASLLPLPLQLCHPAKQQ